jgi:type IV pilus assembly protein PilM
MAEKKSVLTLNLGSQRVGMARFSIGGKGALHLREYAFAEMPGDPTSDGTRRDSLTAATGQLAVMMKAADSEVNYAVPGQFLITKFVKLPPLNEDQVEKMVGFEAQQAVPFPLAETVWDYQLMGKNAGEVEVGIVAVRSEHLGDLNAAVESNKLSPHIVDAAPVALYNAFRYNYPEVADCTLLIDLGARTTNLIYMEGRRAFIATCQTGCAAVTQAIAKEMGMDFDSAEQRKVADGFVNLGGNYADHEDPEIDAMSKVIRNALTKVHGEITRRTNAYRQQQNGNAPVMAYICGAGAALPYAKEVFEEKLRIPVEYFNPIQNVSVGPRVDAEKLGSEAFMLGELVGLALREMACPMELDLAPKSVQSRKDVGSRKPFLMLAAAALFATLGGTWLYNNGAASAFTREKNKLQGVIDGLSVHDSAIKKEEAREKQGADRFYHLNRAIVGQKAWVRIFNRLNNLLVDDSIWIVQIAPVNAELKDGTSELFENAAGEKADSLFKGETLPPAVAQDRSQTTVTHLFVVGVNRNSADAGANAIDLFKKITKDPELANYLDFGKATEAELLKNNLKNAIENVETNDGYPFRMLLPLKKEFHQTIKVQSAKP